jgi:hypothetical protein
VLHCTAELTAVPNECCIRSGHATWRERFNVERDSTNEINAV